jgi:hypothetical protein
MGEESATSLLVGTLQIEIGIRDCVALFVWGLHPHTKWIPTAVSPGDAVVDGGIRFQGLGDLEPGISVVVASVGEWSTQFDASTGWVRVAAREDPDKSLVRIAQDTVIGIKDNALHSIWLKPTFDYSPR